MIDAQFAEEALRRYRVLDDAHRPDFDRLARLAALACHTPIALVDALDTGHLWTRAGQGQGPRALQRSQSFCLHTRAQGDLLVVPDTLDDPRCRDHSLVTGAPFVRFYAGAPILTPDGHAVGAVGVLDTEPRSLSGREADALRDLAALASDELEQRLASWRRDSALDAFAHNGHALVAVDAERRVTFANDAARALYAAPHDPAGHPARALARHRWLHDRDGRACRAALARGQAWSGEALHTRPDGRELRVEMHLSPTFDPHGRRTGLLALVRDVTGRRDEEHHARLLLDHAQDILALHDPDGRILYMNRAGRDPATDASPAGQSGYDFIHPDDRERLRRDGHDLALQGHVTDVEWRRVRPDASVSWMETRTVPVLDEGGRARHLITISRDITARREAQVYTALLESVAVHANDAVLITPARPIDGPEGPRIVYVNDAFCRMTGYTREEVLGRTPRLLQGPKTDRRQLERVRQALDTWTSVTVELVNYRKDGSAFVVEFSVVPVGNENGWPTHWISIQRDITARRAREERLRLLESVVVHASDAVIISEAEPVDAPGPRVLYVNDAYTRMTGYAAEEIVGRTPRIMQGSDTDRATLDRIRARLTAWQPVNETVLNYRKDGRPFWVNLAITPVADETGWFTHWVSVQRDVTRDKLKLDLERDRRRVLEMTTEGAPLPDVLSALLRLLEHQFGDVTASILLLQGDRLHEGVPSALPDALREAANGMRVGPDAGTCGAAAFLGRTVVTTDAGADALWAPWHELAERHGVRAVWSAPILSRNDAVLGTFAVYAHVSRAPMADELALLEDTARLTAVILERYRALDDMHHLALYDPLTDLANRTLFAERLRAALANRRDGELVAVGLLDVDRFKTINDTLGHSAGDELLRQIARRLAHNVPASGSVARMGGDEFTLVLGGLRSAAELASWAQRVLDVFRAPFRVAEREVFVAASLGLAVHPNDADTPEELLRFADVAMYRAKRDVLGWARHDRAAPLPTARHVALEAALHRAIEREEFALHYQPIVRARDGSVRAVEALARWESAEFGTVPPTEFIPIAEACGLIVPIGEWVLRRACRDTAALRRVRPDLTVGVNLSLKQFGRPDLTATVRSALAHAGLDPGALTLEFTESVLLAREDAVERAAELRALGVGLALDDFGTGYSSLSYLKTLPVNAVKLDQGFVARLADDPTGVDAHIVRAVALLCRALGVNLVAEGVETEAQAAFLRAEGVDLLQGWLYGPARPLREALSRLDAPGSRDGARPA